jgi:peptide/nickel transport system permease protein
LGGTIVIEVVFNYPGLGRLMVQAISFRDLATVQAVALILATLYVGLNLFADLLTLVARIRATACTVARSRKDMAWTINRPSPG